MRSGVYLSLKIFDLFGGIGGFSLAAHRAGMETAGYCELNSHAAAIYNTNFGGNHEPKRCHTTHRKNNA